MADEPNPQQVEQDEQKTAAGPDAEVEDLAMEGREAENVAGGAWKKATPSPRFK